jgi:endonuclease/exonuclease/phosphatase family metal-dependent hydrolase
MFTVISWNVQSSRAGTPDQIVEAVHSMGRFDVLCLQEVGGGAENQFEQLAARLPGYTAISALALDTAGEDGQRYQMGSMMFARLPVLQVFRHSLPWPADPEVMSMPRVALEVTLDTPLGLLGVSCVHLEYFSLRQRMAQVDQLRALRAEAHAHAMRPRPGDATAAPFRAVPRAPAAIVTGDFNFLPGSPEHARMLAPLDDGAPALRDAWQTAFPCRPHGPTVGLHDDSPGAGAPFTFDYAFISDDLSGWVQSVQVGQGRHGSAHQPLRLTLA